MRFSIAATLIAAACVAANKEERKLRRHSRKPKYDICGKKNYKKDVPKMSGPVSSQQMLLDNGIISKIPSSVCTAGTGKNVFLVIGDGMGWEMARAGAIAKRVLDELKGMGVDTVNGSTGAVADAAMLAFNGRQLKDYYLEGKGSGLSFQTLPGFGLVETSAMMIGVPTPGEHYAPGRSLLGTATGTVGDHEDRNAPLMLDLCTNKPIEFDPTDYEENKGMIALYNNTKGGYYPWDANYYTYGVGSYSPGFSPEYICRNANDSAPTAAAYATGIKSAVDMISEDLYENIHPTIIEEAMNCGKAGGAITSVPMLHATPAAFYAHSNSRNNARQLRASFEAVNPTYAMGVCQTSLTLTASQLAKYRAGGVKSSEWILLEQGAGGRNASTYYDPIQNASPDNGTHVLACMNPTPARGNMPYRGLDSSYSNRYCGAGSSIRANSTSPITGVKVTTSATPCNYTNAADLVNIPKMNVHVREAVKFLGKSTKGFFLMYEQGDIDWAAHADHMDDMLGAMLDISDGVQEMLDWIAANGGWDKNALYVTADHDHFLTLLPNFPEIVANYIITGKSYMITPLNNTQTNAMSFATDALTNLQNIAGLSQTDALKRMSTWTAQDIINVGHFWGPVGSGGNGWGSHTTRPVPIYYAGDDGCLEQLVGKNFTVVGKQVKGTPGKLSQTHVHACMKKALFGLS